MKLILLFHPLSNGINKIYSSYKIKILIAIPIIIIIMIMVMIMIIQQYNNIT